MASIGETLREARKKKGISEEAASKALRIKLDRLQDLEEDRYDQFPALVYVRSFLRHYADYLGIDGAPLLQQFSEHVPQPEQKAVFEITEDQRARSPMQRHVSASNSATPLTSTGRTVVIATLAVLAVAGACAYWIMKMPPPAALNPSAPESSNPATNSAPASSSSDVWQPPAQTSVPAVAPLSLSTNSLPELHHSP